MNEPPPSRSERWRERLRRLRVRARSVVPFASGVVAAFVALLLYSVLFPGPRQITQHEVSDTIAQAMASATRRPPFSEGVYQIIQPSLVLIQSKLPDVNGKPESGLGSGVVIDDSGDIL